MRSKVNLVRASRDGDQFHYYWADRRCLPLLASSNSLKAVTIEGPSLHEDDQPIVEGEEVIDVAEYYGSENIEEATRGCYIQLKHSTVRVDQKWKPGELENTLKGFAERYMAMKEKYNTDHLENKLEFCFVSNRAIVSSFVKAIHDVAEGLFLEGDNEIAKIKKYTRLSDSDLQGFCKLLYFRNM